jgi:hypothetical protein
MKSMVERIREYFNKRTRAADTAKDAHVERQTLVIENSNCAKRLLANDDFALMFNLYRFSLLERLEESRTDDERDSNAKYVAGVRDFIDFIEKQEYLGRVVQKRTEMS